MSDESVKAEVVDTILTDVAEIAVLTGQIDDLLNPDNNNAAAQQRAVDGAAALKSAVDDLDASVRASANSVAAAQANLAARQAYLASLKVRLA